MSFKLPDFLNWSSLDTLRQKMGAPLTNNFVLTPVYSKISIIDQLNTGGVEITLDDISVHDDGTLLYRGYRGLLHIRDINSIAGDTRMPRYHLAFCQTLEKMKKNARFDRYVVAQTTSGEFKVNIIDREVTSQNVRLNVCQNCLDRIHWQAFSLSGMSRSERQSRVDAFSLPEFFKKYPQDLIGTKPLHTSHTAPLNDYPKNWAELSKAIRHERGHQCESCKDIFSQDDYRFVHVHHRNGLKNDNRNVNLAVLCIACHANQPEHGHLKAHPDYKLFLARHPR
ncbi:HNH endonuclease [Leclercia adecarboxylata]|uniref:HNH endonuclease n=1 Tax=Leclercia adecarboxylata TaxID=83655 RepID=UPI0012A9C529|nr:HNH endonuclease [Leclercia adecarboxylata]MBZ3802643.1 HNH endonuclease [Leclercia adecarboxylata]MBZ3807455.1 HNH endonuclease [Leclercia adecarboxylata]MDH0061038.1 HNH endonuclease [Leclercia adecarboxylata]MEC3905294.1 HNH endonuclease [Leclercia adecarboxylata]QFH63981.1 HNH endonuclease [Leclercia adecarboxylata]